jgi:hypothetical protein
MRSRAPREAKNNGVRVVRALSLWPTVPKSVLRLRRAA